MATPMDFDAVVLGTGLAESITAAALSKAGFKVAHIDHNQYYGGDEASLTLDELAEWADARGEASDFPSSDYLAHQRQRYTSVSRAGTIPPQARQYSVSLAPSIIPSIGPHIDSLVASGVSRYGSFKLLEKVAVYDRPGFVQSVPGSKEDVFKSKVLSLVDKRRLMRFLMFAAGDFEGKKEIEGKEQMPFPLFLQESFSLKDNAASAIAYALAFCTSAEDPTLPAMQRIRQYLRSAGRYGTSPFLVGHYGGVGETAQGFCRTSAVKGGTYILGRSVEGVTLPSTQSDNHPQDEKIPAPVTPESRYGVKLEGFDELVTAKVLLSSPDYVPSSLLSAHGPVASSSSTPCVLARCIAIIDMPLVFTPEGAPEPSAPPAEEGEDPVDGEAAAPEVPAPPDYEVDTALLVFPPGCLAGGSTISAAHALVIGEGSMSAPKGKWILNISLPLPAASQPTSSAEEMLKPYLDAALSLTVPPSSPDASPASPLYSVFYFHSAPPSVAPVSAMPTMIVTPPCTQLLPALADAATENAEKMFWKAVEQLKTAGAQRVVLKEPALRKETNVEMEKDADEVPEDVAEPEAIDSFWPPLEASEDPAADEW